MGISRNYSAKRTTSNNQGCNTDNQIRLGVITMSKGTTRKKKSNYKGYLGIFRRAKLLLKEKKLTLTELGAFVTFLLSADWDKDHTNFGVIESDSEMEESTSIDSSTWSRHRNTLTAKGFLDNSEDGEIRIHNFWKYLPEHANKLAKYDIASLQDEDAILQELDAKMQNSVAIMQNSPSQSGHGVSQETIDKTSQLHTPVANMQSSFSHKETINNLRENIEKYNDASHRDFSYEEGNTYPCIDCGKEISGTVANYSYKRFEGVYCFKCQKVKGS